MFFSKCIPPFLKEFFKTNYKARLRKYQYIFIKIEKNLKNILTHDLRGAILNTVEKNSTRKEESECHTLMITEN